MAMIFRNVLEMPVPYRRTFIAENPINFILLMPSPMVEQQILEQVTRLVALQTTANELLQRLVTVERG